MPLWELQKQIRGLQYSRKLKDKIIHMEVGEKSPSPKSAQLAFERNRKSPNFPRGKKRVEHTSNIMAAQQHGLCLAFNYLGYLMLQPPKVACCWARKPAISQTLEEERPQIPGKQTYKSLCNWEIACRGSGKMLFHKRLRIPLPPNCQDFNQHEVLHGRSQFP